MKKSAKKKPEMKAQTSVQLVVPLKEVVREQLREFVIAQGMKALTELLEDERKELCGPAYERGVQSAGHRAGSAPGRLVMGGRRVTVRRPRVRDEPAFATGRARWSCPPGPRWRTRTPSKRAPWSRWSSG